MGQCYSVILKVRVKDEDGAIRALRAKLVRGKQEHTEYSLDHYKEIGVGVESLDDLLRIFFGGWNARLTPIKYRNADALSSGFDASYGWEGVMIEAFNDIAPYLKDGSMLIIDVDEGRDRGVVKDGQCVWVE